VRENIAKLKKRGVGFVGPASGELACGTEGAGRLVEPEDIVDAVKERLSADDLKGEKVLVTAGSTREAFDPIRFLSNASSGLMGYALARAARRRGAEVILVSGPSNLPRPGQVSFVGVEDANEMREEVLCHFPQSTIVIMAAAVSDFRPALRHSKKMKKGADKLTIDFEQTSDILKELGEMNKDGRAGDKFLVGFSLETEDLKKNATGKLQNKNLDMVVANGPVGLGSQTNEVMVIDSTGTALELPPMAKEEVAERILDRVVELKG
ncbi:MAG: bifunctional phosphopantothenoylcysteine decarboxylase/phosphopantothenate--cysteine ligase CoaBC, partial [Deltaproteobacteria bacterium]|nr:bifunctional phosphopantothenoylcysteine decarboxylase/phosphopantothenate--cysteine ligase CoaBC [Deltaproteobacteria bacterium]